MAVGSFVTFQSALTHAAKGDDGCHVDPANYKLGLAMYCSYFVLFSGTRASGQVFHEMVAIALNETVAPQKKNTFLSA